MASKSVSAPLYKPIDSTKYEIRLLQIPFSMLRNLGQVDSKPLTAKLIHHTLPTGSTSFSKKLVKAVTRRAYIALSYVWGDPSLTNEIIIDGHPVPITYSLYTALRQLQCDAFGEETIWVDALCINQADDVEKSAQIRNMREVYHNAANVRVWLGPAEGADDEIYECMQFIQTLTNVFLPDKYVPRHEVWEAYVLPVVLRPLGLTAQTVLSGVHKGNMFKETFRDNKDGTTPSQTLGKEAEEEFFEEYLNWEPEPKHLQKFRKLVPEGDLQTVASKIEEYLIVQPEWFSRIWVVQEVGVAWEEIDVCRGSYNIDWSSVLMVIFWLHFRCDAKFRFIEKVRGLEVIRLGYRDGKRRRLIELVYECRFRRATNPRDKLYGLYGLMGDVVSDFLKPDYSKSVEEVYAQATLHFIQQAGSLNPICSQQKVNKQEGLPSWVPDFELDLSLAEEPLIALDREEVLFSASGQDERATYTISDPDIALLEWSILRTHGIRIGTIAHLSESVNAIHDITAIQRKWRATLSAFLGTTEPQDAEKVRTALDGIETTFEQYSDLVSNTASKTSSGSGDSPEKPATDTPSSSGTAFVPESPSDIDMTSPLVLSYLNVLRTGRSDPTTRISLPSMLRLPTVDYSPKITHPTSGQRPSPTTKTNSFPSLNTSLHKTFGSGRASTRTTTTPAARTASSSSATLIPKNTSDATLEDPKEATTRTRASDHPAKNTDSSHFLTEMAYVETCMRHKRFFATSEGNLGSATENIRQGDEVVVLFGCDLPVVLRQVEMSDDPRGNAKRSSEGGSKWEFVGEAFVDGFMDGEAVAWLARGRWERGVEDFVLV